MGFKTVRTNNGLAISLGNTGMGKIPSISSNRTTCGELSKYCSKYCYNNFSSRMYKAVKNVQDNNTELIQNWSQAKIVGELDNFLKKYNPSLFRIHVNGDFMDQKEVDSWVAISILNPATKFLAFTKRYDLLNPSLINSLPNNLKLRVSIFFNMPYRIQDELAVTGLPIAYTDINNIYNYRECSKPCDTCQYCYNSLGHVYLPLHGKKAIKSYHKETRTVSFLPQKGC